MELLFLCSRESLSFVFSTYPACNFVYRKLVDWTDDDQGSTDFEIDFAF